MRKFVKLWEGKSAMSWKTNRYSMQLSVHDMDGLTRWSEQYQSSSISGIKAPINNIIELLVLMNCFATIDIDKSHGHKLYCLIKSHWNRSMYVMTNLWSILWDLDLITTLTNYRYIPWEGGGSGCLYFTE